ncbi:MAG: GNAT family N-acetyltransferase [Patescibacteria group bacterium]
MLVSEPKFLTSPDVLYEVAGKSIALYGYAPEHNVYDYKYAIDEDTDNIFVSFNDDMGILAKKEKQEPIWWMLAEPLAPDLKRVEILVIFLKNIFQAQGAVQANLELMEDTYKAFIKALPDNLQAQEPSEILTAPIFELDQFDPELRGNKYKNIRSFVRQYHKAHTIEVLDATKLSIKDLLDFIARWRRGRTAQDEPLDEYYMHIVRENFLGFDTARAVISDGIIVGLNGGWRVPNGGQYYKAFGLHDYSDRALGDVMMVEELSWLKRAGYKKADFGAGNKTLTDFKKRFHPNSYYKVYEFIVESAPALK